MAFRTGHRSSPRVGLDVLTPDRGTGHRVETNRRSTPDEVEPVGNECRAVLERVQVEGPAMNLLGSKDGALLDELQTDDSAAVAVWRTDPVSVDDGVWELAIRVSGRSQPRNNRPRSRQWTSACGVVNQSRYS